MMALLAHSREVLRTYGNMSSATVMFVLARMLAASQPDAARLRRGVRARPERRGDDLPGRRPRMSWDVAIAGGGLAGAAAACHLADAGRRVVLLERERGPHHKVCGEFWSIEAQGHLDTSGRRPPAAAVARRARRSSRSTSSAASRRPRHHCPSWPGACHATVSTPGCWSRRSAAGSPCETGRSVQRARLRRRRRAAAVRGRGRSPPTWPCSPPASTSYAAGSGQGTPPDLIGFKQHFRLADAQRQALARQGRDCPVRRRLCRAAADRGRFGQSLPRGDAGPLCWPGQGLASPARLRCHTSPGGWMVPRPAGRSRWRSIAFPMGTSMPAEEQASVYRVGDQAAVIPSFTGDGMAMALHSARLASDAILAGHPPAVYHRELRHGVPASVTGCRCRCCHGYHHLAAAADDRRMPSGAGTVDRHRRPDANQGRLTG